MGHVGVGTIDDPAKRPRGQAQDIMEKFLCLADENEPIAADLCRETAGAAVCYVTVELRTQGEDVHDDGYVDDAHGHDVGHGTCLAFGHRVSGAWDSCGHKVSPLIMARQPLDWLRALRVYFGVVRSCGERSAVHGRPPSCLVVTHLTIANAAPSRKRPRMHARRRSAIRGKPCRRGRTQW